MQLTAELTRAWFAAARAAGQGDPRTGITWTPAESEALRVGQDAVQAALHGSVIPAAAGPDDDLAGHLGALAAGIAAARAADGQRAGEAGPVHLAAGLMAAAARAVALTTEPDRGPVRPGVRGASGPSSGWAGAALHRGAVAAVEAALAGADVAGTARAAVSGAVLVKAAADVAAADLRLVTAVGTVLRALERAADLSGSEHARPSCGAAPGTTAGREFLAELTFRLLVTPDVAFSVRRALEEQGAEVVVWGSGDSHEFHVHTRRAGPVLAALFTWQQPFDLTVTAL